MSDAICLPSRLRSRSRPALCCSPRFLQCFSTGSPCLRCRHPCHLSYVYSYRSSPNLFCLRLRACSIHRYPLASHILPAQPGFLCHRYYVYYYPGHCSSPLYIWYSPCSATCHLRYLRSVSLPIAFISPCRRCLYTPAVSPVLLPLWSIRRCSFFCRSTVSRHASMSSVTPRRYPFGYRSCRCHCRLSPWHPLLLDTLRPSARPCRSLSWISASPLGVRLIVVGLLVCWFVLSSHVSIALLYDDGLF